MVIRSKSAVCFPVLCSPMDKKSQSSGKPPWHGFNLSRLNLIRRWNTLPLYQRGAPQQGGSAPQSKIYQSLGNLGPLQRPPISWARQQGILSSQLPLPTRQMTVGSMQARNRPEQRKMDSSFYGYNLPTGQTLGEHSLAGGELGSFDASIFASSPNSLYMYEQEKADMQSSLNVPNCTNSSNMFFSDDFDLEDTYETSQDIALVSDNLLVEGTCATSQDSDGQNKTLQSQLSKCDDVFEDPTLAELNFHPLLEDIGNLAPNCSSSEVRGKSSTSTMQSSLTRDYLKSWESMQSNVDKKGTQSTASSALSSAWTLAGLSTSSTATWPIGGLTKPSTTTDTYLNRRTLSTSSMSNKPTVPLRQISETVSSSTDMKSELTPLPDICTRGSVSTEKCSNQVLKALIGSKRVQSPPRITPVTTSTTTLGKRRSPVSTPFDSSDVDQKWEEIRQFIHDDMHNLPTRSKIKRESIDSVGSVASVDEGDSDIGSSSEDEDWNDSDSDSDNNQDSSWSAKKKKDSTSKKDQYFWQYNIQSKGPKGTRMNFDLEPKNPHVLQDFEDPVFDLEKGRKLGLCKSIRHGGKARKGDGNNVEPNPKKLGAIGLQLKKINKQINAFAPLCDMPVSTRNKSKKEKNKLASRACRLKKKAQHEAYKVKLFGLELEHKQLMTVMDEIKSRVRLVLDKKEEEGNLSSHLDNLIKQHLTVMVAGHTTDFVNKVIKKVEDGDPTGGLET
ncbi:CREB3 regulatory factor-like isoform X1 [Argopecten irradians]|uniref:CREB3 regulatory factor-like isoform X1 n=2 Tax=Argopecten irradians TaxID=31199 RepID=UPI003716CDB0